MLGLVRRAWPDGHAVMSFHRQVGAVSQSHQSLSVDDGDDAPSGANEICTIKGLHRDGHSGPLHAEHDGEKLMRERQLTAVDTIIGHEQPSGQALCVLVAAVSQRVCAV